MQAETKELLRSEGACFFQREPRFGESPGRRRFLSLALPAIVLVSTSWNLLTSGRAIAQPVDNGLPNPGDNQPNALPAPAANDNGKLFDEALAKVFPEQGFRSNIRLDDSVVKLVENGVIDRAKFEAIYQGGGGLPAELKNALDGPSTGTILLTRTNASYYVNLLWPLGLANYMSGNEASPVNGSSLFNFASTGGWNLGKEQNGGAYFNKLKLVALTPEQEALVIRIAQNTYRPCCNNSTFFQDCNHGSALLGLLELGAAQGLDEQQLYREALAFNSFWFPQNYVQTAVYFKAVSNTDWERVDAKTVMGKDFSTSSGAGAAARKVSELGLFPQQRGGPSCGVSLEKEVNEAVRVAQRGCPGCSACSTCSA